MNLTMPAIPIWELVVRATVVYFVFILLIRVGGRREVGQVTIFDLAALVLAANALQPAITGPDATLPGGIIVVVTLFGLNRLVGWARFHTVLVGRFFAVGARVIGMNGAWLPDAIRKEEIDSDELEEALREHGLENVSEVKLAEIEPDGSISIVPFANVNRTRRRRMKGPGRN